MTGNTWDIIKIQTKTNQLMMGNRKDHIRVRGQRQRKTKSDNYTIIVQLVNSEVHCKLFWNESTQINDNINTDIITFKRSICVGMNVSMCVND